MSGRPCLWCGSARTRTTSRTVVVGYRREGRRSIPEEGRRRGRHCADCGGWEQDAAGGRAAR